MRYMSAEEQENRFVKGFGSDLGAKYYVLHSQVIHVHMNWAMINELVKDQERRSLLQSTGGYVFVEVHKAFVNDVIVRLSRLTDPARQGQHDNLSLWALLDDSCCDPCLKSKSEKLIKEAEAIISPLRARRDKRSAHFDLDVALNPNVSLPPISDQSVDEALLAVGEVLEQLMEGYTGTSREQLWVPIETVPNIEGLLHYLEAGLSQSTVAQG